MKSQLQQYIERTITVSASEMETILAHFHPQTVQKNEFLVRQGQISNRIHFVVSGCLRFYFTNEEGQEATRYFAFENHFATALCSVISGKPSDEFLQAVEHSELLVISREDFLHLPELVPAWEKFYRHYLEKAYVNNTNKLMSLLTLDATERYRQLLSQHQRIVQRLPNKLVASYLNISQETLSRVKSKI